MSWKKVAGVLESSCRGPRSFPGSAPFLPSSWQSSEPSPFLEPPREAWFSRTRRLRRGIPGLCCLGLLMVTGACASRSLEPARLMARYQEAIRDAVVARPDEVERDLRAITAWESGLVWEGEAGNSRVLVATWTYWLGFDDHEGQEMSVERPVWVTLVPEIRDFCRRFGQRRRRPLSLRLEQLIGVPPNNGRSRFAELWVRPEDLFRPCPDPEITDSQCGLESPQGGAFLQVDQEYLDWFEAQQDASYVESGYPWTRLGYTYDWGRRRSKVGLSEFVVRQGASLQVKWVASTEEYCRRP